MVAVPSADVVSAVTEKPLCGLGNTLEESLQGNTTEGQYAARGFIVPQLPAKCPLVVGTCRSLAVVGSELSNAFGRYPSAPGRKCEIGTSCKLALDAEALLTATARPEPTVV